MRFRKNGFLALLAVVVLLQLAQLGLAQTIYVLATNGPDHKDGKLVPFTRAESDAVSIKECFKNNVPEEKLVFYGEQQEWKTVPHASGLIGISKQELLDAIKTCPAGANDTIVVFLTAHGGGGGGGFGGQDHMLLMADGNDKQMHRSDIVQEVRKKGARLSVIMTESCTANVVAEPTCMEPAKLKGMAPLFDELFIKAKGLVDLNSSSPGQYSWSYVFPPTLNGYLYKNAQERKNWPTVVAELRKEVEASFQSTKSRYTPEVIAELKKTEPDWCKKTLPKLLAQKHQTLWVVTRPLPGESVVTPGHECCLKKLMRRIRARRATRRCCCN